MWRESDSPQNSAFSYFSFLKPSEINQESVVRACVRKNFQRSTDWLTGSNEMAQTKKSKRLKNKIHTYQLRKWERERGREKEYVLLGKRRAIEQQKRRRSRARSERVSEWVSEWVSACGRGREWKDPQCSVDRVFVGSRSAGNDNS